MNKTAEQAEAFCRELLKNGSDCGNRVIIFVPYTDLSLCARLCENSFAAVGAQNVHWENSGAFTGEISAQMLREAGAPLTGDVLLALAVFPDEIPDPDALEASLCGLLSASQSLLAQGVAHHVAFWRRAPLAVSSTEDWTRAQRMLLSPPPAPDDMSPAFARIAVFSPCAAIDASDPFARVTLVLPEGAQALVGDIPVAFFGARAPFLTL